LRKLSAQSLFTSHSPYVLEEFALDETVVLARSTSGELTQTTLVLPASVKQKRYRQEFRTRFCEGLLARRVLIAEGATEATALPALARRLAELNPSTYVSLEGLGISVVDAGSDNQIADLAGLYRSLGKDTFAICDHQEPAQKVAIDAVVRLLFMHSETGFEDLVLNNTTLAAMKRFANSLTWPPHLKTKYPKLNGQAAAALKEYFLWSKGNWGIADFLSQCTEGEVPEWLRNVCLALKATCQLPKDVCPTGKPKAQIGGRTHRKATRDTRLDRPSISDRGAGIWQNDGCHFESRENGWRGIAARPNRAISEFCAGDGRAHS
jgi:putative ATP-dependent endonuclease of OLD family